MHHTQRRARRGLVARQHGTKELREDETSRVAFQVSAENQHEEPTQIRDLIETSRKKT